jgi:NDP-sugar pyrophosphorylase family protein
MKAVFLCGGVGKRMFPVTQDKFLLDFLGKPLLQHQVELAQQAGLQDFVMVGNPANMGSLERAVGGIAGIRAEFAVQEGATGMAGALQCAAQYLDGQVLLVSPDDVLSGLAYSSILSEACGGAASCCMLGYRVAEYFPGGYLEVDSRGYLKHIVEKPAVGKEPGDLVNIVVHLHNEAAILRDYLAAVDTGRDDVYERALDNMLKDGHRIKVVPYVDFWAPLKYPWHIFKVMEHYLDAAEPYVSPSARISDRALIDGKVILADNARVLENAVLRGPAYIGPGSVIGNNALVRDYSHIGASSVVGYCTEVKHSYIGRNCWFHSNYVGDSIIESDCSFGSGAVTANFRLDEQKVCVEVDGISVDTGYDKLGAMLGQGCRLGIHASLMPGVRVGCHSLVGPRVCLHSDLAPGKKALPVSRYRVLDNDADLTPDKRRELRRRLDPGPLTRHSPLSDHPSRVRHQGAELDD